MTDTITPDETTPATAQFVPVPVPAELSDRQVLDLIHEQNQQALAYLAALWNVVGPLGVAAEQLAAGGPAGMLGLLRTLRG